jgi:hypothetical protein
MVSLVRTFHSVNAGSAPQLSLPVLVDGNGSYIYEGGNYGDIEFPSLAQDRQTIEQFLGVSSDINTMTGAPLPAPSTITVEVKNGTGVADQAGETATALHGDGFKISGTGNTAPVAQQSETVVYYRAKSEIAAAEAVLNSFSGTAIMSLDPAMASAGADVTVVTGTDFSIERTSLSEQSSTARASLEAQVTASSSIGGASSTTGLGAPTAANPPLEPWDPRSCTSAGGEGA